MSAKDKKREWLAEHRPDIIQERECKREKDREAVLAAIRELGEGCTYKEIAAHIGRDVSDALVSLKFEGKIKKVSGYFLQEYSIDEKLRDLGYE